MNTSKTVFFILSNHPVSLPPLLRDPSEDLASITDSSLATTFSGILYKKRRKKLQGWDLVPEIADCLGYAKRYFTLSTTTGELSYSLNSHNPMLRGTIPLALAALNIDYSRREFIIDSGADIWHLRASNESEFEVWKTRLEDVWLKAVAGRQRSLQDQQEGVEMPSEWKQVEGLVDRLGMMKEFVKGMVNDVSKEKERPQLGLRKSTSNIKELTLVPSGEKKGGLFKKKDKGDKVPGSPPAMYSSPSMNTLHGMTMSNGYSNWLDLDTIAPKLASLDENLASIITSFQTILSNLRLSVPGATTTVPIRRMSMQSRRLSQDSAGDDWFDARSVELEPEQGLITVVEQESESDHRPAETSDEEEEELGAGAVNVLLTMSPERRGSVKKDLYPLPEWKGKAIKRRKTLPAPVTIPPPSLLSFLRKNVGKDFSTIAMPVTSNEPTTLLQRLTEDLEYSNLLDKAATSKDSHQRMLYLALFAQSYLSSFRAPKRAIRKSFTPLLAETYELVREDKCFRFLAEKVSHRPQIFAAHAESEKWTWSFCPSPRQKFWGKSFEMTIEGTVKVVLNTTGEVITWQKPACYMRNIIAGEKYIEPVGEQIIWNHTTGEKAVVEFKPTKGMWGGRAEDLAITTYGKEGKVGLRAEGKWTESVHGVHDGKEVWRVGELVENDDKYCGFPIFTAQLSEITPLEEGALCPTDSRLRPDRKLHEAGKMDEAEDIKLRLEEEQRVRRGLGKEPPVRWFEKVTLETEGLSPRRLSPPSTAENGIGSDSEEGDEEVWRLKEGKDGYWHRRQNCNWEGVVRLW